LDCDTESRQDLRAQSAWVGLDGGQGIPGCAAECVPAALGFKNIRIGLEGFDSHAQIHFLVAGVQVGWRSVSPLDWPQPPAQDYQAQKQANHKSYGCCNDGLIELFTNCVHIFSLEFLSIGMPPIQVAKIL
jgi:hypothetical protein